MIRNLFKNIKKWLDTPFVDPTPQPKKKCCGCGCGKKHDYTKLKIPRKA